MTEHIDTEIDLSEDDKNTKKVVAGDGDDRSSSQEGDDFEIEVQDDTPEHDRGRAPKAPGTKSAVPTDEEIGEYTKGVQDRFRQMKWEYHEERRAKEAWERQSNAAVEYAKKIHEENKKLRDMLTKGHKTLVDSTKASAENEITALQESLKTALETGNTALAAELQSKVARAAARAEAQNHVAPLSFPDDEQQPQATQQSQQAQKPPVRVSQSMQAWMDENPWFNENKRMTAFAFGVHEELIAKGIPVESPRYFQEINKSVRETFKNYFADDEQDIDGRTDRRPANGQNGQRRRTPVAGVSRSKTDKGNKVTLTSSEMAVAKRMGISVEAYAREKVRLENLDG